MVFDDTSEVQYTLTVPPITGVPWLGIEFNILLQWHDACACHSFAYTTEFGKTSWQNNSNGITSVDHLTFNLLPLSYFFSADYVDPVVEP